MNVQCLRNIMDPVVEFIFKVVLKIVKLAFQCTEEAAIATRRGGGIEDGLAQHRGVKLKEGSVWLNKGGSLDKYGKKIIVFHKSWLRTCEDA